MTEPSFMRDTRASYDSVAADYAQRFQGELAGKPLDRALFAAFAELVQAGRRPGCRHRARPRPRSRLPGWLGLDRVLASGGHLLLAFQAGDERRHVTEAFGHPVSVDAYRLPPDHFAGLLGQAGLDLQAQLIREPYEGLETDQRAYLLARKPAASQS